MTRHAMIGAAVVIGAAVPEVRASAWLPGRNSTGRTSTVVFSNPARLPDPRLCAAEVGPNRNRTRCVPLVNGQAEFGWRRLDARLTGERGGTDATQSTTSVSFSPSIAWSFSRLPDLSIGFGLEWRQAFEGEWSGDDDTYQWHDLGTESVRLGLDGGVGYRILGAKLSGGFGPSLTVDRSRHRRRVTGASSSEVGEWNDRFSWLSAALRLGVSAEPLPDFVVGLAFDTPSLFDGNLEGDGAVSLVNGPEEMRRAKWHKASESHESPGRIRLGAEWSFRVGAALRSEFEWELASSLPPRIAYEGNRCGRSCRVVDKRSVGRDLLRGTVEARGWLNRRFEVRGAAIMTRSSVGGSALTPLANELSSLGVGVGAWWWPTDRVGLDVAYLHTSELETERDAPPRRAQPRPAEYDATAGALTLSVTWIAR